MGLFQKVGQLADKNCLQTVKRSFLFFFSPPFLALPLFLQKKHRFIFVPLIGLGDRELLKAAETPDASVLFIHLSCLSFSLSIFLTLMLLSPCLSSLSLSPDSTPCIAVRSSMWPSTFLLCSSISLSVVTQLLHSPHISETHTLRTHMQVSAGQEIEIVCVIHFAVHGKLRCESVGSLKG